MRLAAPFMEMCREMLEMRYLWQVRAELDNTKLEALIGPEPHTPLDAAVASSLAALKAESSKRNTPRDPGTRPPRHEMVAFRPRTMPDRALVVSATNLLSRGFLVVPTDRRAPDGA